MKIPCSRGPYPFWAVQGRERPRSTAKHEIGLLELEDSIQRKDREICLYSRRTKSINGLQSMHGW